MKLLAFATILSFALLKAQEAASEAQEVAVAEVAEALEEVVISQEGFLVEQDTKGCGIGRRCGHRKHSSSSSSSGCGCPYNPDPSSSSDCCDQCPKTYFDFMDFYTSKPILPDGSNGPLVTWEYWTNVDLNYTADQGTLTTGCNGALVNSVFSVDNVQAPTEDPNVDRNKYYVLTETAMPVPNHGDAIVKFRGTASTFKTGDNPFPASLLDGPNDYRLAHARFVTLDEAHGLECSFLLTNNRVFAFYSRQPGAILKAGEEESQWAGFAFLVPVKIRKLCDWHDMAIVYHGDHRQISWHLDGREVFLITHPGFLLDRDYMVNDNGGNEELIWPTEIVYGFGTFTALDWYPSCGRVKSCDTCRYPVNRQALLDLTTTAGFIQYNPIFGWDVVPEQLAVFYKDGTDLDDHAWNQGANIKLHKLIAYQKVPVCKK